MAVMEMHHHKKPTSALTPEQAKMIQDSHKAARERRSGKPSVIAQVDPFAVLPTPEADPFN